MQVRSRFVMRQSEMGGLSRKALRSRGGGEARTGRVNSPATGGRDGRGAQNQQGQWTKAPPPHAPTGTRQHFPEKQEAATTALHEDVTPELRIDALCVRS